MTGAANKTELPPGSRKQSQCFLGIDPGLTGAIAVYDRTCGELVKVEAIPIRFSAVKSSKKREYDRPALKLLLSTLKESYWLHSAFIERVHAMPGDGRVGAFSFGKGYGILLMALEMIDVPTVEIPPAVWKGSMNLGRDKKHSLRLARSLFPGFSDRFVRVSKDDGLAEAALLAYFGATRFK